MAGFAFPGFVVVNAVRNRPGKLDPETFEKLYCRLVECRDIPDQSIKLGLG